MRHHIKAQLENNDSGEEELARLRAELDQIDDLLMNSVRDRIRCCIRIAMCKRIYSIPMMQPHRVAFVHSRARAFGETNGLDPAFMQALYELVIQETCRVEDEIIGNPALSGRSEN